MKGLICFLGVCLGRPHPDAKAHDALASIAPHVRVPNSQARLNRWRLYALIPVVLAALFNVGGQYFQGLYLEDLTLDGWRDRWIDAYGMHLSSGLDAFLVAGLVHVLPVVGVAYITGALWEGLFAHLRGRTRQPGLLVTVLVFTALLPPAASLWHVVLAMSFAIVFAQEVFGGPGKTFLPPALVGVAVLQVSFPSALTAHALWTLVDGYAGTGAFALFDRDGVSALLWAGMDETNAFLGNVQGVLGASGVLASLVGAAVLLASGAANFRAMLGVGIGMALVVGLTDWGLDFHWHVLLGGAVFCAVFVVTDLGGSSATQAGRWVQGLLAGAMVVLIRIYHPAHPDGVVPAFLFAAILGPLIDAAVVRLQVRLARARAGRRRARL